MIPDDHTRRPDPDLAPEEPRTASLRESGRLAEMARLVETFRGAIVALRESLEAMETEEVCGESANGSIRISYGLFGDLRRVEIVPDFLKSVRADRLETALLDAFRSAQSAAHEARSRYEKDLTFMGIPVSALRTGSVKKLLPSLQNIRDIFEKGDQQK